MKNICMIAVLALIMVSPLWLWSGDEANGAQLYKTKCAMCHGANGEGKPAAEMPALKGVSLSVEKLVTYLTKGESGKGIHENPVNDLSAEQAKLVAEYVKTLK
jgi:cytochrome c553